jgi:hypothetical protein
LLARGAYKGYKKKRKKENKKCDARQKFLHPPIVADVRERGQEKLNYFCFQTSEKRP